jgi:hypothetical protein
MSEQGERRFIDVRPEGDLTVVTLKVRRLEEDDVYVFAEEVHALIREGRTKILIKLNQPQTLYSVFLSKLVRIKREAERSGGWLYLFGLETGEFFSLFQACRLEREFGLEVDTDGGTTNPELRQIFSRSLVWRCPISGCRHSIRRPDPRLRPTGDGSMSCPECRARFEVAVESLPLVGESSVPLRQFSLPSYEGAAVGVTPFDGAAVLTVSDRLDLFVLDQVERAWATLPSPRRVVVNVKGLKEVSPRAGAGLVALLKSGWPLDQGILFWDDSVPKEIAADFPSASSLPTAIGMLPSSLQAAFPCVTIRVEG